MTTPAAFKPTSISPSAPSGRQYTSLPSPLKQPLHPSSQSLEPSSNNDGSTTKPFRQAQRLPRPHHRRQLRDGFGLASAVLELGGHVIISSSSTQRISHAIDRLRALHPDLPDDGTAAIIGIPCNLGHFETLSEQITSLFAEVATHLGGRNQLDHVVFTAGDALPIQPLEAFSLPQIQQAGTVRFFAPLVVAQHLRQHLRPTSGSSFTLTTGGVPQHLMKNWSIAQAYLGGIESMARGLAVDLAPVRVNAIGLGPVETELWDGAKEAGLYEDVRARFEAKMTTGRVGEVGDVVEAYLYVLRDGNVSGSTVRSHGGTVLL